MLRVGTWCVNPASGQISRDGKTARVEERTMRLLLCLAEHAGQVVSIDDLLSQVWAGVSVAPDSVYQAVASLRRLLGDDPKQPTYIATVPRLGYRMVAAVSPWEDTAETSDSRVSVGERPTAADTNKTSEPRHRAIITWAGGAVFGLAVVVALVFVFLFRGKVLSNNQSASAAGTQLPQKSIAVLPFIDLTEGMHQEEFADGMTEELIDKLGKIPGLRVPSATSSFYFKGKLWPLPHGTPQITVADIGKMLGVAYVFDGSVRKSSARMRVAARLISADNGYVIWTETYDRTLHDTVSVQDDIAGEITKALTATMARN